jgi:hypothetical protein
MTIPATAQALSGNFTVVNQLSNYGFGVVYPSGGGLPQTSNVNYTPFAVKPNAFVTGLGAGGQFNLYAFSTVHAVVDVAGYFTP